MAQVALAPDGLQQSLNGTTLQGAPNFAIGFEAMGAQNVDVNEPKIKVQGNQFQFDRAKEMAQRLKAPQPVSGATNNLSRRRHPKCYTGLRNIHQRPSLMTPRAVQPLQQASMHPMPMRAKHAAHHTLKRQQLLAQANKPAVKAPVQEKRPEATVALGPTNPAVLEAKRRQLALHRRRQLCMGPGMAA